MKRKVKFQEGGMVETPGQRRARLADSARTRSLEFFEDMRRRNRAAAAEREASRQRFEQERRFAGRQDFTTDPQGTTRRGAATGREVVPFQEPGAPARPSAGRALAEVGTPRPMSLGSPRPRVGGSLATLGGALAMEAAEPLINYGRRNAERYAAEADARREANLQAFRNRELNEPAEGPTAGSMQTAPAPRPAPRPRPAAAPREISADRLNELAMGAEPANAEERLAQMRMLGRRQELEERGTAFKKGGMVKPKAKPVAKKAGGMVGKPKAAPKKMMKGGVVAKPKSKAKPMAKPMPFKKGGKISMKGKK